MQTAFHHSDVPPQNWLDELHSFNIVRVWDIQLENQQRLNLVERAQNSLNGWRSALRDQIKKIEGRYDASNREVMQKMLTPYKILDTLGTDLNTQLLDLRDRVKNGKAIPQGFEFGIRIFGDLATERWYLGDREDEQRWRDFIAIERRYQSLGKEYKVQSRGYDNAKKRVDEAKADLKRLKLNYQKQTGFLQIGVRVFIVLLTVIFCLIVGAIAFMLDFPEGARISNEILAGIMLIFAVIGSIAAVMLARRRREAIALLETEITELEESLDSQKREARRQRQYLLPTRQTLKEVKADYQLLKESF